MQTDDPPRDGSMIEASMHAARSRAASIWSNSTASMTASM
jgi:hypothetical protein